MVEDADGVHFVVFIAEGIWSWVSETDGERYERKWIIVHANNCQTTILSENGRTEEFYIGIIALSLLNS